jgi:inosose dehydratase
MIPQRENTRSLIGTQLYVWSQVCRRDGASLEERLVPVLAEAAAAGFEAVEPTLTMCASLELRERLRDSLTSNGLQAPSFYVGGTFHEETAFQQDLAATLPLARVAAEMGCGALCINPSVKREGKSDEELQTQIRNLNRMGAALRELGMRLWLHNHDPEMREDGRELRRTLDETDPACVGYCADVHWIFRGGGDPYEYLERYGSRVGSLHVRNSRAGIWSEDFGEGDIDYGRVRRILDRHGFAGPIYVELAIEAETPQTRPLLESARLSRQYAERVLRR